MASDYNRRLRKAARAAPHTDKYHQRIGRKLATKKKRKPPAEDGIGNLTPTQGKKE